MTTKVGINGFGRIGRLALRRIYATNSDVLEVVAINDLTSPDMLAHLLKYDTAHGQFNHEVSATENSIVIDGKNIPVYAESDARNIPWVKNDGVDLVLESTGFYTSEEKSQAHIDAGAKKFLSQLLLVLLRQLFTVLMMTQSQLTITSSQQLHVLQTV